MKLILLLGGLLSLSPFLLSGPAVAGVTYDDVAVVVNVNSTASKTIGAYFQSARNIPAVNIIPVSVPDQEVIDDATFASLRSQIETYLSAHSLKSSINYLVTTKGVPLKINREANGAEPFSTSSASASVESELALLPGSNSASIGKPGKIISLYYNAGRHFSSAAFGMYLVTRLDGYSVSDVLDLIDRAHPGLATDGSAVFVFDEDPVWNATVPYLNTYMADAARELGEKGEHVRLNSDSVYVTYSSNVLGYASWGSNDHFAHDFTLYAKPHNTWAPGAIAETYVSTSGRSFAFPPVYGQSLIADLVAEGVSGAKGYVYEPYSSSMAVSSILFNVYIGGYNLAESFYQSSVYLSWMDVIIGDPKVSIDGSSPAPLPVQLSSLTAASDEAAGSIDIQWTTQSEIQNYGFYVQRRSPGRGEFADIAGSFQHGAGNSLAAHQYAYEDRPSSAGAFEYRLRQVDLDGSEHFSESVVAVLNAMTSVRPEGSPPGEFRLEQNFPNPFNPSTTIEYAITGIRGQASGVRSVRLVVYNELGQEIATLVDERKAPGRYRVVWDAGKHPSGAYFYRLTVGDISATKTMLVTK